MRGIRVFFLLAACWLPGLAMAEPGPIVAVFDLDDRSQVLDDRSLADLGDYLAVLLTEGGWQVVPRDQLRARIIEQKAEGFKECYDQSCQVELGRELAAQKTLATQVFKVGTRCRVTATVYDLMRAATEKAVREEAACQVDELGLALERIAASITRKLDGASLERARREQEEAAKEKNRAEEATKEKDGVEVATKEKDGVEVAAKEKDGVEVAAEEKNRVATPAARSHFKPTAVLGASLGIVSPGILSNNSVWIFPKTGDSYGYSTNPGVFAELLCDFPLWRYFSIGLALTFVHAETTQEGTIHGTFDFLAPSLRLKGRLPFAEVLELRLGLGLGMVNVMYLPPEIEETEMVGLSVHMTLEFAWWITPQLGVTATLGNISMPVGGLGEKGDMTMDPAINFTLGVEYGL